MPFKKNDEKKSVWVRYASGSEVIAAMTDSQIAEASKEKNVLEIREVRAEACEPMPTKKYTLQDIFDKNYVVHCDTEGKANKLLRAFDNMGWEWSKGIKYTDFNRWERYKNYTCFRPFYGGYCDVEYYRAMGITIVEFDDVILTSDSFIDSIFSNPNAGVVAVKFSNGSKKVLHLQKGDKFDLEKAVALAIAEKQCGGYSKFKEEIENSIKDGKNKKEKENEKEKVRN